MLLMVESSIGYVDPGAGSMIVQLLIASCLGGIAFCRQRILAFFRRKKPGNEPDTRQNPSDGERR